MKDLQNKIQEAFDLVDRRQNDAALAVVNDLLAQIPPPNRITEVPAGRATIYDWLLIARKSLKGEPSMVGPKIALRSALALVH